MWFSEETEVVRMLPPMRKKVRTLKNPCKFKRVNLLHCSPLFPNNFADQVETDKGHVCFNGSVVASNFGEIQPKH